MTTLKLSISVEDRLVRFVDEYRRRNPGKSRSEVFGDAVALLRSTEAERVLEAAYAQSAAEDRLVARDFEGTLDDGLADEAW